MNKSALVRLIALVALFEAFSTTCKEERLIDKYLGKWEFEVINSIFVYQLNSNILLSSSEDTILYTGTIIPGSGDNGIVVQCTEYLNINLSVDSNGQILKNCLPPSTCHGEFSDINTLHYFYSSRVNNSNNTTTSSHTEISGRRI